MTGTVRAHFQPLPRGGLSEKAGTVRAHERPTEETTLADFGRYGPRSEPTLHENDPCRFWWRRSGGMSHPFVNLRGRTIQMAIKG